MAIETPWHLNAALALPMREFDLMEKIPPTSEFADNAAHVCTTAIHKPSGIYVDFFSDSPNGKKHRPVFRIRLNAEPGAKKRALWYGLDGKPLDFEGNRHMDFLDVQERDFFEQIRLHALQAMRLHAPQ